MINQKTAKNDIDVLWRFYKMSKKEGRGVIYPDFSFLNYRKRRFLGIPSPRQKKGSNLWGTIWRKRAVFVPKTCCWGWNAFFGRIPVHDHFLDFSRKKHFFFAEFLTPWAFPPLPFLGVFFSQFWTLFDVLWKLFLEKSLPCKFAHILGPALRPNYHFFV